MPQNQSVDVRPSADSDFDSFYDCFAGICRERRFLALVEPPSQDSARMFMADARRRGMVQYFAVEGAVVAGWCDVIPADFEGCRHVGRLGMGLRPQYRGQGIGWRLLDAVVRAARQAGLTRIELDVFSTNEPAIRLYERYGFVHEGARRKARIIDGRVEDIVLMGIVFDDLLSREARSWR